MSAAVDLSQARSRFAGLTPSPKRTAKPLDVNRLFEELADAEAEQHIHRETWRQCMDLTMPDRQNMDGQQVGQARTPVEKFDSYPIKATRRGCGNLIGALCPPEQQWAEAVPGPEIPEDRRDKVAAGLEDISKAVFDYLARSRFATEVYGAGMDLLVSTGFMAIDVGTKERPFVVRSVPMVECFPVEGPDGEIETVFRKYQCRVSYLRRQWPGLRLSSRLAQLAERDPKAKCTIVEASVFEPGRGQRFAVIDAEDKTVMYDVQPTDADEPSRWITPRLYKRPGDRYGYGPLVEALPEIRKVNKVDELELKAGARLMAPPIGLDTDTGLNPHTMRSGPNGVNMINGRGLDGRPPFYPFPQSAIPQWSQISKQDSHALIDAMLFAQEVVPPVSDSHQMTAFEVSVRRQQLLVQQGVDLGRLQYELPFAVMRRCVWILGKLGLIPPIKLDNRFFSIRYLGPLAQAQDADKASSVLAFVGQSRAALGDEATTLGVKVEDVAAYVGEMWPGVPASLLRDDGERKTMQEQAAQVAAMQAAGQAPQMQQSALPGSV